MANASSSGRRRSPQTDRAVRAAFIGLAGLVIGCGPSAEQDERQRVAIKIDEVRDATTSDTRDKALAELDALQTTTAEAKRAREVCLEVYRKLSTAQAALAKFDAASKDLAGLLKTEEDLAAARARMPECEDAIGALKLVR